ncbi:TAXI family TRAP transporter solute-binding subunit [Vibrio sp. S4M6]|nr:TAXI family TRAP transporter solute-binding subunit [Vibrio sinus]
MIVSLLTLMLSTAPVYAQQFITIGTGSVTGVYYPAGGAICKLVNEGRKQHHTRCSVESTGGSIFNVNAIREKELDFGIVQSDWQYHGYNGTNKFSKQGPYKKLRALFSLHTEPFNLIAQPDANIQSLKDIKGTRVDIGNPGSGDRATMGVVMQAMGWTGESFQQPSKLTGAKRSQALCDNKIDAFVYVVGHPNGPIKEATTACGAKLVPVTGPQIDKIVAGKPYYAYSMIPAGMYSDIQPEVQSFGVLATLVTSTNTSNEVAYIVTKAVFENFDTFITMHPALANIKKEDMITSGISIPLHPGAKKYYREVGLIK